ncbi:hypothetical protein CVT25_007763 [Psilocybe cyanescens]|uniref:Uncharacterized protein n=1 Tax=Psilocybe cyanescens TaxID=93625 RepID=A0A409XI11_PSICY|nr:hypothetical protein CVT25_007763 [Psilocybe cyanescens]
MPGHWHSEAFYQRSALILFAIVPRSPFRDSLVLPRQTAGCTTLGCLCTSTVAQGLQNCVDCLVTASPTADVIAGAQALVGTYMGQCTSPGLPPVTVKSGSGGGPSISSPIKTFSTVTPPSVTTFRTSPSVPTTTSTSPIITSKITSPAVPTTTSTPPITTPKITSPAVPTTTSTPTITTPTITSPAVPTTTSTPLIATPTITSPNLPTNPSISQPTVHLFTSVGITGGPGQGIPGGQTGKGISTHSMSSLGAFGLSLLFGVLLAF